MPNARLSQAVGFPTGWLPSAIENVDTHSWDPGTVFFCPPPVANSAETPTTCSHGSKRSIIKWIMTFGENKKAEWRVAPLHGKILFFAKQLERYELNADNSITCCVYSALVAQRNVGDATAEGEPVGILSTGSTTERTSRKRFTFGADSYNDVRDATAERTLLALSPGSATERIRKRLTLALILTVSAGEEHRAAAGCSVRGPL